MIIVNNFSVKMDNDLSLLYRDDTRGIDSSELERPKESLDELAAILNIEIDVLSRKDYWYKYKQDFYYLKKRCQKYLKKLLIMKNLKKCIFKN